MKKVLSVFLAVLMLAAAVTSLSSCGREILFGKEVLAVGGQLDALQGLKKGDAQIAVIDSVMAGYYMKSEGFADYTTLDFTLATEEYGIGAKKGNDALIGKVNEAIIALSDGKYKEIAEKYGLSQELLVTKSTVNPQANAADGSFEAIKTSGKLNIGYTEFAPIAYEENGTLIGFDIDLAKAVVEYLNATYNAAIEVNFVKIVWENKETDLQNGTIDLVWNGMTIDDERIAAMSMSIAYMANKQAVVVKKTDKATYESADRAEFVSKVKDVVVIVEKGSAGEAQAVKAG